MSNIAGDGGFRLLAESILDDFFLYDEAGAFLDVNERACLSLGYTRPELLRMEVGDISLGRSYSDRDHVWRRMAAGTSVTLHAHHQRKDGPAFPVELHLSCHWIEGRKLFFGIARDITERVRQETAIERLNLELEQRVVERTKQVSEMTDLLQAVMDSAKDAIFLKDTEGRFLLFNRAAESFSGHSAAAVIGKTSAEVFGPVVGGVMMAQEQAVFARGETTTVEETHTMKGVQRVFLATRSLRRNASGKVVGLVGVSRDITERKIAENELRAQRERLILAAQVGGFGVWDYHIDTDTLYCDERWYRIVGRDPSNPIRSIEEFKRFIHPEDVRHATEVNPVSLAELLTHQHDYSNLFRIIRPDGAIRWLRSAACLIEGGPGLPNRAVGVVSDVTESHEAAEALKTAKEAAEAAERTKSDFLATVSHEIRTPMSTVIGLTRLTLKTDLSEKQRGYLERIDYSARRLLAIINDVLDISKIEAGYLVLEDTTFKLDSVLDSVTHICGLRAQEKGLELIYSIGADVPRLLRGDPLRLSQVLTNLVSNALKFTERGEIRISIELLPGGTQTRTLQFSVRDTGIGLDAEQLSRLFRPFAQADSDTARRYGGTGLGLVICKRIVERMGGRIWAEGRPGRGSTFRFKVTLRDEREATTTLPTESEPAAAPESAKTWPALAGRRVLVVDDNAFNRDLAVELLALVGMNVDIAGSAAAAIEMVGRTPYDVILMDLQMPDMDGMEAARRLQQDPANPPPPIIAVTARARVEDYDASRKAGMLAHLTKPIEDTLLYITLTNILGGAGNSYNTGTQTAAPGLGEAHAADDAPLDFSRVLQRVHGDEARLERLLLGFRRDFTDAPQRLETIDAAGNLPEIAMLAHAVKGAAGYLVAARLVSVAATLESAARGGDRGQVGKLGPVLAEELSSVLREIEDRLPRRTLPLALPVDRRTAIELVTRIEPLLARGDHRAEALLGDLAAVVGAGELAPVVEELRVQCEDLELVAAGATLSRLGALLQEPAS